ncbi:UNVERIFIED_CONTAM: polysaccharide pyruvyl transferase family protein [Kocuria sp. CPCC 205316]|uniref:polysaccharide pyruvyl transferase family protein n=1 Tax=Kocuria TaxID=57493 RepID=UPI0036DC6191
MNLTSQALRGFRDSRLYDYFTSSSLYRLGVLHGDRIIGRISRRFSACPEGSQTGHILVAPTGGGNIGDQALVEAFLQTVDGKVTILLSSADAISIPAEHQNRVIVKSGRAFIYLPPLVRIPAVWRMTKLIKAATSVSVLGADLMDGLYNAGATVARVSTLCLARELGKPSVLVGCSWSGSARKTAVLALRLAADLGAVVNARDPVSAERMNRDGISNVQQTADIVFALTGTHVNNDVRLAIERGRVLGRRIAVVNMSGLIGRRFDQLPEYRQIVSALTRQNYFVVLLPHVFRSTGDDLSECERLTDQLGLETIYLVAQQLTPREVKWLVGESDLVVTGRMHLAVMSLSSRRPVITLGSHGKVEGLYAYFPWMPGFVEPTPGFGTEVVAAIEAVLGRQGDWDQALTDVKLLAERNVLSLKP